MEAITVELHLKIKIKLGTVGKVSKEMIKYIRAVEENEKKLS
jgi:hypothetical protein